MNTGCVVYKTVMSYKCRCRRSLAAC